MDRFVDAVVLAVQERRVEPGSRVVRIEAPGLGEFLRGPAAVSGVAVRLAEVTPQEGPVRFQTGGDLQVFPAAFGIGMPDLQEPPSEPGVAQRAIERDGLIKGLMRLVISTLRSQEKTLQRQRFGIPRAGGQ